MLRLLIVNISNDIAYTTSWIYDILVRTCVELFLLLKNKHVCYYAAFIIQFSINYFYLPCQEETCLKVL